MYKYKLHKKSIEGKRVFFFPPILFHQNGNSYNLTPHHKKTKGGDISTFCKSL